MMKKTCWQVIQEAKYALVDGNLSKELIPPERVAGWLDAISEALEDGGAARLQRLQDAATNYA